MRKKMIPATGMWYVYHARFPFGMCLTWNLEIPGYHKFKGRNIIGRSYACVYERRRCGLEVFHTSDNVTLG